LGLDLDFSGRGAVILGTGVGARSAGGGIGEGLVIIIMLEMLSQGSRRGSGGAVVTTILKPRVLAGDGVGFGS